MGHGTDFNTYEFDRFVSRLDDFDYNQKHNPDTWNFLNLTHLKFNFLDSLRCNISVFLERQYATHK